MTGWYRAPGARLLGVALSIVSLFAVQGTVYARGSAEVTRAAQRRQLIAELDQSGAVFPVAIAAVVAPDLDDADRQILGALAETVRDLVTGPEYRYLSTDDRRAIAERVIATRLRELEVQAESRRRAVERARLEAPRLRAEGALSDALAEDGRYTELIDARALLATVGAEEIAVPDRLPLSILDEPRRYRQILPAVSGLAREFPSAELLIILDVETVGQRLLLRVIAADPHSGQRQEILRILGDRNSLPAELERQERRVVAAVAGRSLGAMRVAVEDVGGAEYRDARVFLNGSYRGVAPVRDEYLLPDTYEVVAELPDGRVGSVPVEVGPDQTENVRVVIDDPPPGQVSIRSVPSGARVYRGSLWVGFTPVSVSRSDAAETFTVSAEGFYDSRVTVDADSPAEVETVLVSVDTDWAAEVTDARDRFYRAFGWFALSVGVPVLVNGVYQTYGGLAGADGTALSDDLNATEQEQILREANTLYYGYYASLGLSVGLFGNMIWRLVGYVRTAGEYHTR